MPPPSRDQFHGLLEELSAGVFAHLVADVWEARGWTVEVRRAGSGPHVVEASRDEPVAERQMLIVRAPPSRFRPDRKIRPDVTHVVTNGLASRRTKEFAEAIDATLVDGNDLYGMVRYAIDRDARDRIFQDHFDRPAASFESRPMSLRPGFALRSPSPHVLTIVGIALLIAAWMVAFLGVSGPGAGVFSGEPTATPGVGGGAHTVDSGRDSSGVSAAGRSIDYLIYSESPRSRFPDRIPSEGSDEGVRPSGEESLPERSSATPHAGNASFGPETVGDRRAIDVFVSEPVSRPFQNSVMTSIPRVS